MVTLSQKRHLVSYVVKITEQPVCETNFWSSFVYSSLDLGEINLNGPVSSLDESFLIDFNSPEMKQKLQKLLEKLKDGEI